MRIIEILTEGITDVVYHYADVLSAYKILNDGEFKLSDATGNYSEEKIAPEGYPFFMSVTRSKVGDYHASPGPSGVMFVLDGRWLSQRYKGAPVDYWERDWAKTNSRTSESEDRIFSRENTIPITPVTEIHLLNRLNVPERAYQLRSIILNAKKLGIPVYFYNDQKAWVLQDKRRALPVDQYKSYLKGKEHSTINRGKMSYFSHLTELLYQDNYDSLSSKAKKSLLNLTNYTDSVQSIKVDLSNSAKPGRSTYPDARKFMAHLKKFGIKDIQQFREYVINKWKDKR